MRKAVYAGSFDPITNGHLWMIEQGMELFNELTVAIGTNPEKKYTFTISDRLRMVRQSIGHLPGVRVDTIENRFLGHYAASVGAQYILRGIRSEGDYQYERTMRHINSDLHADITTVFLIPPREIAEVSSSMVKSLIGPEGWQDIVHQYIPDPVYQVVLDQYGRR